MIVRGGGHRGSGLGHRGRGIGRESPGLVAEEGADGLADGLGVGWGGGRLLGDGGEGVEGLLLQGGEDEVGADGGDADDGVGGAEERLGGHDLGELVDGQAVAGADLGGGDVVVGEVGKEGGGSGHGGERIRGLIGFQGFCLGVGGD